MLRAQDYPIVWKYFQLCIPKWISEYLTSKGHFNAWSFFKYFLKLTFKFIERRLRTMFFSDFFYIFIASAFAEAVCIFINAWG